MKGFILTVALLMLAATAGAQENFLTTPNYEGGVEPWVLKDAADLNNRGVEKALIENDYKGATKLFRLAVALDARCLKCRYNLGMSLINSENYDESEIIFAELIAFAPTYADGYAGLGEAQYKKGLFKESLATYRKAAELDSSDPVLLSNMGNALHQNKEYEEALRYFNMALKLNPNHGGVYSNRGATLMALGRKKEALKDLQRAVELEPTLAEAQNNLGVVLTALGREKEAHKYYMEAVRLYPRWSSALYNLTISYMKLGKREAARQSLSVLSQVDSSLTEKAEKAFYGQFLIDVRGL